MIRFVKNDGGRKAAGFQGQTGDCATRAIAIVTGKPYREVYDAVNKLGASERTGKKKRGKSSASGGVYKQAMHKYLATLGFTWTPTMKIGQGCTVHVRENELPAGRLILNLSRHYAAVVDGILHHTYDSSRDGRRCVYGYWRLES